MAAMPSRQSAFTPSTPLLSTFQKHVEDMRNLVLCKVCIKPLYEPYNLGCGHTYCYTCLASWFGGANKRKRKTCPDCRAQVTAQPSPNYLLRDLVHMFISRIELLPEDETTNEHDDAKRAEALQIDTDKGAGGEGLFKGAFGNSLQQNGLRPIRDDEDGVDRCPVCAWELEEGQCMYCGYNEDEDEDGSDGSGDTRALASPSIISINSEIDADLDPDDHDLEDEYDEDEDDEYIHPDRRPNITHPSMHDVSGTYRNGPLQRISYHVSTTSDEEDVEAGGRQHPCHRGVRYDSGGESDGENTAVPDEDIYETATNEDDEAMTSSYDSSDAESEIITGTRRDHREPMPDTERDQSPSVAEPNSPGSFYAEALAAGNPGYGFSPIRSTSPTSNIALLRSPKSNTESDDEYQSTVRNRALSYNRIPRRPARVIISSEDESEDHTPTPPRPVAERRAHLRDQRARRGGRGRDGGAHGPNLAWSEARRRFQEDVRR